MTRHSWAGSSFAEMRLNGPPGLGLPNRLLGHLARPRGDRKREEWSPESLDSLAPYLPEVKKTQDLRGADAAPVTARVVTLNDKNGKLPASPANELSRRPT